MKPDFPTVYRRKDLKSSVKKTRKSAVIKTSVILNRLLEELNVTIIQSRLPMSCWTLSMMWSRENKRSIP